LGQITRLATIASIFGTRIAKRRSQHSGSGPMPLKLATDKDLMLFKGCGIYLWFGVKRLFKKT
jgi:hypothetical protein